MNYAGSLINQKGIGDGQCTHLGDPIHTAIVASVNGTRVTVIHQNVDGQTAIQKSRVRAQEFDLSKRVSGSCIVYRAVPR